MIQVLTKSYNGLWYNKTGFYTGILHYKFREVLKMEEEGSIYKDFKTSNATSIIFSCILILGSALFLGHTNFLAYHTIVELITIIIALMMGTIALSTYKVNEDNKIIFLGIAYAFIAGLDLIHMLTYKGMGIFGDDTFNTPLQLWIAARYVESLSFLISFILSDKPFNIRKVLLNYLIVFIFIFISIFHLDIFPSCYIEGFGLTPFKRANEYIICGILLGGVIYFIEHAPSKLKETDRFIILSLISTIISEIFLIQYMDIYSLSNVLGHAFKLISFYFLYIALVQSSIQKPYATLFKMNKILAKKNQKLEDLIYRLKIEYDKRKENEARSFKKKKMFNAILESSANGILVIDNDNRIIHFNRKFIYMMDTSCELVPGKYCNGTISFIKDRLCNPEKIEKIINEPLELHEGNAYYFRTKNERIFEVSILPFIDKGILSGKLINFRDITERRKMEELQRKAEIRQSLLEKAKEVEELKSSFIRTISHEIKTPLNIILGVVQLLSFEDNGNECFQLSKGNVEMIKKNCFRLVKLTDNLIDINQIDSGFMYLNLENHNIISIIEDIVLSVVKHADCKGISLVFDTDIEERMIACDIEALQRIMLNLLSNAIKFTEFGGKIQVSIKDKKESVIISVKDNGVGIPKDMVDTIFDRFKQVDTSLRRKQEGSGIGLSIVKSMVEMHGGEIFLNSEVDKGTEFIIELPVKLVDHKHFKNNSYMDKRTDIDRIQIEFSDIYELN